MIKCVIVDDEPWALELLKTYVDKVDFLELALATTRPLEAINFLSAQPVDLLLLDIQMPEINGIDLMKILATKTKVIITSAYSEYAVQSYEYNVVDYLVKPFEFTRFYKAIQKVKDEIDATSKSVRNFIFVKTDGKLVKLFYDEILIIEGLKDYISIKTEKEKLISLDSLYSMEAQLPPDQFCRIHKSYIVAIQKINTIERNRVFIGEAVLPIGESYKQAFFKIVGK